MRSPPARVRPRSRRDPPPPKARDRLTRDRLIEAAGELIAERGVDRVTGKEICARARANTAAINYHFGGLQGLYAAVLCEAHHRLAAVDTLQAVFAGAGSPAAKLEAIIHLFITVLLRQASSAWIVPVLGRELVFPSPAFGVLREKEVLPKLDIIRQLVAQLMDLPVDHPAVARGCISTMAPCLLLVYGSRRTLRQMLPNFGFDPGDAETVTAHLVRFALSGLKTVAADVHRGK